MNELHMTIEQVKRLRLCGQHLLSPTDVCSAARDLCGVQAQYLTHAFHALRIRSAGDDVANSSGLVKTWTIRGTMHLFREEDLPLMLHRDRRNILRPCDTLSSDALVSGERKQRFADVIAEAVKAGCVERESLRRLCAAAGMTESEAQSIFNPWGGTLRALCEAGVLTHAVSEKKAFVSCPPFVPMQKEAAEIELARRYFAHYGPATIRDAASFFGCRQAEVRRWLEHIPARVVRCGDRTYYWVEEMPDFQADDPQCLFLAGFDPLLLGYEKKENPFLPPEYLREIYSLSGIVMPALLLHGSVAGRWKRTGGRLSVTLFDPAARQDAALIRAQALQLWPSLTRIDGI